MENKKIAKKYFKKYFESNYLEETDLEFKSLVRILNKIGKPSKTDNNFKKDVKEMVDEILKLATYDSNHDNILDNFGDIEMTIKRFNKKYYKAKQP